MAGGFQPSGSSKQLFSLRGSGNSAAFGGSYFEAMVNLPAWPSNPDRRRSQPSQSQLLSIVANFPRNNSFFFFFAFSRFPLFSTTVTRQNIFSFAGPRELLAIFRFVFISGGFHSRGCLYRQMESLGQVRFVAFEKGCRPT